MSFPCIPAIFEELLNIDSVKSIRKFKRWNLTLAEYKIPVSLTLFKIYSSNMTKASGLEKGSQSALGTPGSLAWEMDNLLVFQYHMT